MFNFLQSLSPIFLVNVKEQSMTPFLRNNDNILVLKYYFLKPRIGDIVVFNYPAPPFIFIKRIVKVFKNKFWVEGDNKKESLDSRKFGYIKKNQIIGKMILKL